MRMILGYCTVQFILGRPGSYVWVCAMEFLDMEKFTSTVFFVCLFVCLFTIFHFNFLGGGGGGRRQRHPYRMYSILSCRTLAMKRLDLAFIHETTFAKKKKAAMIGGGTSQYFTGLGYRFL
jgi:hypothetical protein